MVDGQAQFDGAREAVVADHRVVPVAAHGVEPADGELLEGKQGCRGDLMEVAFAEVLAITATASRKNKSGFRNV